MIKQKRQSNTPVKPFSVLVERMRCDRIVYKIETVCKFVVTNKSKVEVEKTRICAMHTHFIDNTIKHSIPLFFHQNWKTQKASCIECSFCCFSWMLFSFLFLFLSFWVIDCHLFVIHLDRFVRCFFM